MWSCNHEPRHRRLAVCRRKERAPAGHPEDEKKLGGVPGHLQAAVQQLVGQPPVGGKSEAKADTADHGGKSTDRPPAEED